MKTLLFLIFLENLSLKFLMTHCSVYWKNVAYKMHSMKIFCFKFFSKIASLFVETSGSLFPEIQEKSHLLLWEKETMMDKRLNSVISFFLVTKEKISRWKFIFNVKKIQINYSNINMRTFSLLLVGIYQRLIQWLIWLPVIIW